MSASQLISDARRSPLLVLLGAGGALSIVCTGCLIITMLFAGAASGERADLLPTRADLASAPTLPPTFTPKPTFRAVEVINPTPTKKPTPTDMPDLAIPQTQPPPTALPPTTVPSRTPLPYNLVSSLHVDGWEVRVERVEVMSHIPGVSQDSIPQGRYAILFFLVTNQQGYTDTFVPVGSISLEDSQGRDYEEDYTASSSAWYYFRTETGAYVEPGQSAHVVAAYDIPGSEGNYYLVPGPLTDDQPNRIAVRIPNGYTMAPGPRATDTPFSTDYDPPDDDGGGRGCCKVCVKGKACGDTCINRSYTCHVGPGCACNGSLPGFGVAAVFEDLVQDPAATAEMCTPLTPLSMRYN